jgi:hypothetical protein
MLLTAYDATQLTTGARQEAPAKVRMVPANVAQRHLNIEKKFR